MICCIGRGISDSLACTDFGEGGETRTIGFCGGVGGYEWRVGSPVSVVSDSDDLRTDEFLLVADDEGMFVRQEKMRAASL